MPDSMARCPVSPNPGVSSAADSPSHLSPVEPARCSNTVRRQARRARRRQRRMWCDSAATSPRPTVPREPVAVVPAARRRGRSPARSSRSRDQGGRAFAEVGEREFLDADRPCPELRRQRRIRRGDADDLMRLSTRTARLDNLPPLSLGRQQDRSRGGARRASPRRCHAVARTAVTAP